MASEAHVVGLTGHTILQSTAGNLVVTDREGGAILIQRADVKELLTAIEKAAKE